MLEEREVRAPNWRTSEGTGKKGAIDVLPTGSTIVLSHMMIFLHSVSPGHIGKGQKNQA